MQSATTPPDSSNIAIRYGRNFGLIQAVIAVSILLFDTFVARDSGLAPLFVGSVGFLLISALSFAAGFLASKQTGRLSTGVFAGLWTGIFYGAITYIASLVTSGFANGFDAFQTGAIFAIAVIDVFGVFMAVGLGAGLGLLGGLIGGSKSQFRPAPPSNPGQPGDQPYMEQPY